MEAKVWSIARNVEQKMKMMQPFVKAVGCRLLGRSLVILFEVVIKDMAKTYSWLSWVNTVQWNWIFAFVIAIFIIAFGLRVISKR